MDQFEALDAATGELRSRLAALTSGQLEWRSNCPDWTVKDLANHVIGGTERYGLLLRGAHDAQLVGTRTHDYTADGAVAALDQHAGEMTALFGQPGALDTRVAHRAGEVTGAELLGMSVIEQTLHAWDLAVSVGGDTHLDDTLCAYTLDWWIDSIDRLREFGVYADPTPAREDSAQGRLLAYAGRARA